VLRHELDRTSPEVPSHPSNPFLFVPASRESTTYDELQVGWALPLQLRKSVLTLGAGVEREDGKNDSTLALPTGDVDGSYSLDRTNAGAFVEWVADRGPVLVELGARVDAPEDFDTELSPRAGVSYRRQNAPTTFRVSAGRGFKLPSFFALASPPALGGNPDLEPETSISADAGIEHRFEAIDLTASLTVFHHEFEDLITFDFNTFRHVNLSDVRSRGAELALGWTPSPEIGVHANLTGQDVRNPDSPDPLRQRPDWIGGARLAWRPIEKLRWGLDGQWVSESFDEQIPVPSRTTTAGYGLVGSAVSYRWSRSWAVHARVDNLLDKEYETFIGFPGPDRGFRVGLCRCEAASGGL
jgi:vitamin B12 transporter